MGRNEIRLRRQRISSGRIARHRNYTELMRQHDKEVRLKRVLRVFTYFLIILFLLILLLIVIRWEGKQTSQSTSRQVEIQQEIQIT
jgi:preprotein translocase subunit SecG